MQQNIHFDISYKQPLLIYISFFSFPPTGYQQTVRNYALGHRQVLAYCLSGLLRVLQPDVLDHLSARERRRGG